ncbi:pilus biosynthesis protein HicB [Synergistales bacterium]|nr:pilus biosynthesis protein HicB [Synergistales bacterium]GHV53903.1 pilus biosynthesis protein HicB [Synergistales bacterium]
MSVSDYMRLPYNVIIRRMNDESGSYYFAHVMEFDGCMSDGDTIADVYANIYEAMEGWIETKLENGYQIPEPFSSERRSGAFVVHLPGTLRARLTVEAEKEGVTLNQYALRKLSV